MATFPLPWDEFAFISHLRGTTHVQIPSAKALSPLLTFLIRTLIAPLMLRLHLLNHGLSVFARSSGVEIHLPFSVIVLSAGDTTLFSQGFRRLLTHLHCMEELYPCPIEKSRISFICDFFCRQKTRPIPLETT